MNKIFKTKILLTEILPKVLLLTLIFGCAAKEPELDLADVKKKDRIYTGTLNLTFNGKKNEDLKCEVFLDMSYNSDFKVPRDGFVVFKDSSRDLKIHKISCPFKAGKDKIWVYHHLELLPIKKPRDRNEVTYFGNLDINWTFTEKDLKDLNENLKKAGELVENRGKFEVKITSDLAVHEAIAKQKIKDFQTNTQLKIIENAFKLDEDTLQEKKDAEDDY